jgi:hypothetical protein
MASGVRTVEAEACTLPLFLCRKEGVEYLVYNLRMNSTTSVSNGQNHISAGFDADRHVAFILEM